MFKLNLQALIPEAVSKRQAVRRRNTRRFLWFIVFFTIIIAIFSYFTNPFVRFSVVTDPHAEFSWQEDQIEISFDESVILKNGPFSRSMAKLKSAWHIVSSKFTGGQKAEANTVDGIIEEIHEVRFDPEEPFLISGDHFSVLYPRSLGIFYHSILDSRTALDEEDWQNKQIIYLKTLAYALEVFSQSEDLSTTIVPVGPRSVALMNIYAPPSDTLFSLLYAFDQLMSQDFQQQQYPYQSDVYYDLSTQEVAKRLLETHQESLERHFDNYWQDIYDQETGLVKQNILLSGTKDIVKRKGAFYDNVIAWKTYQLAQDLGVVAQDEEFLQSYKEKIIDTYWLEAEGHFLSEMSQEARDSQWYSSDWMIAFQVGFLDPTNETEKKYLTRSVDYIQRNAIDQPFGLQYHPDLRKHRVYWLVRISASEYASTAIWSNQGMEYIKLLVRLYQLTGEERYLEQAGDQLEAYTFNIKRYRGYPEVYDQDGDFFRTFLYKSIRRTGWVVSFEQARAMYEWEVDLNEVSTAD